MERTPILFTNGAVDPRDAGGYTGGASASGLPGSVRALMFP